MAIRQNLFPINQLELRLFIKYMVNDRSFSRHRWNRNSKRCDSWGSFRNHRRKANWRLSYANGKMQIVNLLFSCASWIFFRRHRNNDNLNGLCKYIYKSGDYYIGEFKDGCRHEHGWFAYIVIIYNTLIFCNFPFNSRWLSTLLFILFW